MEIYDVDKQKWYKIERTFFGTLKLREIIYEAIIRCPVPGDLVFSTKLKRFNMAPEPRTP